VKNFLRWLVGHKFSVMDLVLLAVLATVLRDRLPTMGFWDHAGMVALVFFYFLVQSIVRQAVVRD
jgi:uncharacterized protein YggT (Ycf19 family)